ncbi:MAG: hypothetical protein O3C23_00865 [bacterium]|nr:hypothetical protein [bacterium]
MGKRILSLEQIRYAMRTGRMVRFVLWSSGYPYEGKITGELYAFQNPEDKVCTPVFCFEGKRLGEIRIGGTFPIIAGQVFVDILDPQDTLWRVRQVWRQSKALLLRARLIGLGTN